MGASQSCLHPRVHQTVDVAKAAKAAEAANADGQPHPQLPVEDTGGKGATCAPAPAAAAPRASSCDAGSSTCSDDGGATRSSSEDGSSSDNGCGPASAEAATARGEALLACCCSTAGSSNESLRFDPQQTPAAAAHLGTAPDSGVPYDVHESGPPRPPCEDERVCAVTQLARLLDAAPREELRNILSLVCSIFRVENALIALFGDRRVYITSSVGGFKEGDFPWRWSMCGWTMASEQHSVMVIPDTLQDARFSDNPYVVNSGVRFYCGAPLISSTGHRLGTLCFADTSPRQFDTSGLQVSELVTRELEKDIALAQQTHELKRPLRDGQQEAAQQHAALAGAQQQQAQEASSGLGRERYDMLLRTIDCVTSAVLLVDTSRPEWPVLHANSGWQRLCAQCPVGAGSGGEHDDGGARAIVGHSLWRMLDPAVLSQFGASNSSRSTGYFSGSQLCGGRGGGSSIAAAAALGPGGAGFSSSSVSASSSSSATSSSSSSSASSNSGGGWCPGEQVLQQVAGRQSFSLRGLHLCSAFGGAKAQLTFRCAGYSTLEGGVAICLPTFAPDASERHGGASPSASPSASTSGGSLYFVTVKLHAAGSESGSVTSSSCRSSLWTHDSAGSHAAAAPGGASSGGSKPGSAASLPELCISTEFPQLDGAVQPDAAGLLGSSFGDAQASGAAAGGSNPGRLFVVANLGELQSHASQHHVQQQGACGSAESNVTASGSGGGAAAAAAAASGSGSSANSLAAGLVCKQIAGLRLGGQIAVGSYGRVYRGDYFGSKVAVKVLDGAAVLRRDESTGFCLEALLSETLRHPNIVRTLAWAVVTGEGRLPERKRLWGETLGPGKPSIAQNAAALQKAKSHAAIAPAPFGDGLLQLHGSGGSVHGGGAGGSGGGRAGDNDGEPVSAELLLVDADDAGADVLCGQTFMLMEFCNKGCLQDAVDRGWLRDQRSCVSGQPAVLAVLATATEIASGMALLHSRGIVHGDLSAFNVMLSGDDPACAVGDRGFVAKVADFGLARMLTHGSKFVTKTYGTITHMPPEVLEAGLTSKAADVYSFGVLLWQMVTGSRAWAGMSHMAIVDAVCSKRRTLVFPDDAPEALVMLGRACLAYCPADRPTFDDVLEVLEPMHKLLLAQSPAAAAAAAAAGDASASGPAAGSIGAGGASAVHPVADEGAMHGVEGF